jgi:predicted phage terminase large subunit-like protein
MIPQSLADLVANKSSLTIPQLADLVQRLKELAASQGVGSSAFEDPASFAVAMSAGRWYRTPHLDVLSDRLAALENGTAKVQRLIVNLPPRHGKSELISYWFPLWLLARKPTRRIILVSYEHDFAAGWGRRCRDWVRDHGQEASIALDPYTTAAHRWLLTGGGSMVSAGAGGPITGKGADIIILDDPIKNDEEASSEVLRARIWDWYQTALYTRLEPGGFIIALGTRWHEDDLLGRLERDSTPNPETGERPGLEYDILKLAAVAPKDDPLGRPVGTALWPERYPIEKLQEIRRGMSPYHWSALYQQTPTPEEGNAVKRSWWSYWSSLPDFDVMIQAWDLAFHDMEKSDFCVGQVWGRRGGQFYLVDQIRERMNARDVIKAIKGWAIKYPRAIGKIIEDRANGPAVVQILQRDLGGMIPVKAKGSKDARLQSVIPLIESGACFLPPPDKAGWIGDFIEECAAFPRAQHDDQVDAMVHALRYLQPGAWLHEDKVTRDERLALTLPKTIQEVHDRKIFKALARDRKRAEAKFTKVSFRPKRW